MLPNLYAQLEERTCFLSILRFASPTVAICKDADTWVGNVGPSEQYYDRFTSVAGTSAVRADLWFSPATHTQY